MIRMKRVSAALGISSALVLLAFLQPAQGGPKEKVTQQAQVQDSLIVQLQEQLETCLALQAVATSTSERTWARNCVNLVRKAIEKATSSPTPSPSVTTTTSPSPSVTTTNPPPTTTNPPPTTTAPPPTTTNPPPTTTPPPSPTSTGVLKDCLNNLAACGFPYAGNTGPTGTLAISTRTQYSNSGELIQNLEIRGCIEVHATNVTFRNVRFIGNGCHYLVHNYSTGLRFEDVEANCNDGPNSAMAGPGNFTVLRADIHDCENGFDVQANNVVLRDSWIHDMYDGGDAHTDGLQFGEGASNITVNHNSIIMSLRSNAAIIMWDESGVQNANVAITNNLMSGANYTLRCARFGTSTNVVITGNRFGPNVPGYDHTDSCVGVHVTTWSGNVVDATGAILAPS